MKKIITVLLGGFIITLAVTSNTQAQTGDKGLAFENLKNIKALAGYVNDNTETDKSAAKANRETVNSAKSELKESKANLKAMKANFKATQSFKKEFKDNPDAKWFVEDEAISATFVKDDVKTRAIYDKKGNWIHTISYIPGEKTPSDIRSAIENDYPNDDITLAVRVKEGPNEFYIVQLADKTTYKKVGVYNGQTNLIEELKKSN